MFDYTSQSNRIDQLFVSSLLQRSRKVNPGALSICFSCHVLIHRLGNDLDCYLFYQGSVRPYIDFGLIVKTRKPTTESVLS